MSQFLTSPTLGTFLSTTQNKRTQNLQVLNIKALMGDHRSKSYSGGMQIESYYSRRPNPNQYDFRSYSVSYVSPSKQNYIKNLNNLKRGKNTGGSSSKPWGLNDPEFQRKKRVAGYKVYSVEGKVKGTFRKSMRWIKERYSRVVYGWW